MAKVWGNAIVHYNPSSADMLSGSVAYAILTSTEASARATLYRAWTRTWEGPARPDLLAAEADLRDRMESGA